VAEETIALEVDEEEVGVLDILANQGEEVESEEVEDSEPDTLEDALEALKREREIKTKRNHSLKKSKQATHRIQEENEELLKRLDLMDQRIVGQQPNQEVAKLEQEAQELLDRAIDNPEEMPKYVDYVQKQSEGRIANFLADKFASIEQSISGLKQETDPEMLKYQSQMDQLRTTAGFADLDDNSLLAVTKALSGAKVKKPRGTVGGGKPFTDKNGKFVVTDELRKQMGFKPRGE